MEPHGQGFGCERVTPELLCSLPILSTFGWDGGFGVHTRLPGLRQGTTVCFLTSMDMEQQSDHKLITPSGMGLLVWSDHKLKTPSGMGLLVCGAGSAPFLSPWCGKKDVPTGVNLNQYAGPGSFFRWHSDNVPLFGPQNSPELIVCLSLGNLWSSWCVVACRAKFPLRFGMVTSWSWMVQRNRSMHIARCLGAGSSG